MKTQLTCVVVCSCLSLLMYAAETSAPASPTPAVPAAAVVAPASPAPATPAPPAIVAPTPVTGYADLIPVVTPAAVAVQSLADGSAAAAQGQAVYAGKTALPVEVKTKQAGIALRLIPCGTFMMGSPETEPFHKDAEVLHKVTLSQPFYISATEVTEGQWKSVMGKTHGDLGVNEQLPIEKVTYQDCVDFLKKLCALEGVPEETYTLPTEAQWEYACRAGTSSPYYFGDKLAATQAVFGKKSGEGSRVPVCTFPPNAFGLYETHGNVAEWCKDWWEQAYQRVPQTDPTGAQPGEFKIVRGGAWDKAVTVCRSAERGNLPPSYAWETVGFRIVRTLPLRAE
jgi:formylglycine-generating enzyme required for sulfatase activity